MYVCLDIGGTSIKAAVSDVKGDLINKSKLAISQNFNELVDIIVEYINEAKKKYDIKGVAISAPGAVNPRTGIIHGVSAIPCIHGPKWKEVLKERVKLNISIENDANCAALAEVFYGNAKGLKDVLLVVCGTAIGGSIVKDGKIHTGKHLHGGEFGYMLMGEENGQPRNFSRLASTMSFVRKVRAYYNDDSWDGERVFEEASKGNEVCIEAIDIFYMNLAKGIFNLQHIYDPELILLGGGISARADFIESINEKLEFLQNNLEDTSLKAQIKSCYFKNDANLIGALVNHLQEYGQSWEMVGLYVNSNM